MKKVFKLFLALSFCLPVTIYAQDDDLVNSIDIEGINLLGFPKLDIGLSLGYAYRMEPVPSGLKPSQAAEHANTLKTAAIYGASAYYFKKENMGWGFIFSRYTKSGEMEYVPLQPSFHIKEEVLLTDYYGPSIYFRQSNNSENMYYGPTLGLGFLRFKQDIHAIDKNYNVDSPTDHENFQDYYKKTYTGGALAIQVGMKMQYKITKQFALGAGVNVFMGINSTKGFYQLRMPESAQKESLSRVEAAITIHYLK